MPESTECGKQHDSKRSGPANFPEIALIFCRRDNVMQVHAVVAGEKGKGEEYDGDDGEDHDCFIL